MTTLRSSILDGREVQGSLTESEKPGMVVINTIVESEETSLDSIANLLYYGKTLKSCFTGNVSSGFAYTKIKSDRLPLWQTFALLSFSQFDNNKTEQGKNG